MNGSAPYRLPAELSESPVTRPYPEVPKRPAVSGFSSVPSWEAQRALPPQERVAAMRAGKLRRAETVVELLPRDFLESLVEFASRRPTPAEQAGALAVVKHLMQFHRYVERTAANGAR